MSRSEAAVSESIEGRLHRLEKLALAGLKTARTRQANTLLVRVDHADAFGDVPEGLDRLHAEPHYCHHTTNGHRVAPQTVEWLFSA